MYDYVGLRASQITSHFPGYIPCNCSYDDSKVYKVPRYDVRLSYGSTQYGSKGRIVKEIMVECDCCRSRERYDVERYDVYQNDLNW